MFRDSYQLMSGALCTLVENLKNLDVNLFKQLSAGFNAYAADLEPLLRKGVFPYDWFDTRAKLQDQQLPPIEAFFSTLTQTACKAVDYQHAVAAWTRFGCNTFQDYMLVYLKMDVLQLADVMEAFRNVTLKHYGLDAACFVSAPSLSWCAMLKLTGMHGKKTSTNILDSFLNLTIPLQL